MEIGTILATIMAHGCNIGPYTIAQLIDTVSYKQLKRVSDWQRTEETQRSALATVVNAISGLDREGRDRSHHISAHQPN